MSRKFANGLMLASLLATPRPGAFAQTPIPHDPPQSAVIQSDAQVKTGEAITVHIRLNVATNDPQCCFLTVGVAGPGPVGFGQKVTTVMGKYEYDVPIPIPIDAPGGTYSVSGVMIATFSGMYVSNLKFNKWSFEVVQPSDFVFPTEADVTISLTQIQLLRSAAAVLAVKIKALTSSLAALSDSKSSDRVGQILRRNVHDADEALNDTKTRFLRMAVTDSERDEASVFFDDLHRTYQHALTGIKFAYAQPKSELPVRFRHSDAQTRDPDSIQVVIRAIELNERAYNTVAETGSITFDLKVISVPSGAVVSYGRRGDSSFEKYQDPTNSEIKGLPLAIWIIQFDKPGFGVERLTHNPFTDKNHVVVAELHPGKSKVAK